MKKADRQLNKLIRKTVAITDGMDNKCKALEWLKELRDRIDFQINVIKDDVRSGTAMADHAETVLSELGEPQDHRKEKKRTKKAA